MRARAISFFSKQSSAQELMELDAKLLAALNEGEVPPALRSSKLQLAVDSCSKRLTLLHRYRFERPSVTWGCLFNPSGLLNQLPPSSAQRPTGGGVMIHGWDLCFSLLLAPQHPFAKLGVVESYRQLHQWVAEALQSYWPALKGKLGSSQGSSDPRQQAGRCCLSHPTLYDLTLDGQKVMGSAQRRKKALLHQCSLHLTQPDPVWLKNLFVDGAAYATMIDSASTWLGAHAPIEIEQIEQKIEHYLLAGLESLESC